MLTEAQNLEETTTIHNHLRFYANKITDIPKTQFEIRKLNCDIDFIDYFFHKTSNNRL